MNTLAQILENKAHEIISIRPSDSVLVALEVMAAYNIGALPVLEDGRLMGIFSERDYARKVALKGLNSSTTEVREIMTGDVQCVSPQQSVMDCMAVMSDKRIRHLPVLDGGELVGMLSIGDLVKAIIEDQQFQIQQLEAYINPTLSMH
ncbi:MAG: CBS domain-containing protein [Betaproteobacteria bacterium]|nr:CBS domain-containing protein [Betaproteobacteria bacterium]